MAEEDSENEDTFKDIKNRFAEIQGAFLEQDIFVLRDYIENALVEIYKRLDHLEQQSGISKYNSKKFNKDLIESVFGIWRDVKDSSDFVKEIRNEWEARMKRLGL